MEAWLAASAWWLAHAGAALLCIAGVLISLAGISGSWLVCGAGFLLMAVRPDAAPGWWVNSAFVGVSIVMELYDFLAGKWGVTRRGGSAAASWAALFGGIAGIFAGGLIPIPLVGSLIGMMLGSFLCAYAVEMRRLRHDAQAAHIARGAVWARLQVMVVKTVVALGMTGYLWYAVWTL